MPIYKTLDRGFFKEWTPEMAYVLGFFTADGNMIRNKRGAHFMEFFSTDKDIIKNIRIALGSNHKISVRDRSKINKNWKPAYRLQIGSKEIFNDLLRLGMTPAKSNVIKFPNIQALFIYIPKECSFTRFNGIIFSNITRKNISAKCIYFFIVKDLDFSCVRFFVRDCF